MNYAYLPFIIIIIFLGNTRRIEPLNSKWIEHKLAELELILAM